MVQEKHKMHVYLHNYKCFLMNFGHQTFILMNTIDIPWKYFACD